MMRLFSSDFFLINLYYRILFFNIVATTENSKVSLNISSHRFFRLSYETQKKLIKLVI